MFVKAFTIATLASYASAHMLMANPKPYGNPNNSPLEADGSNFPCKGAVNDGASTNSYKAGSTQQLSFIGSAVHGGGSCQVSLTTDKNPTKDSVWKVIHSIEGGCPAKNQAGNYPENANFEDPDKYDFKIPEELAAGDYVLAWTWFNHVGNREMYMNCAAVTVQGEGGSKGYLDSLPDMFVANIGNDCETPPDTDLAFPNPGNSVSKLKSLLTDPKGPGCQKPGSGSGSGGGSAQPSTPVAAPTSDNGAQPTQPATTPAPGAGSGSGDGSNGAPEIPGGAFITVSQPAASQPSATQAPEASATPATPETPKNGSGEDAGSDKGAGSDGGNNGGNSGSGSGSGGFAAGTACTSEGEWNCIGGSSFQRCASGTWTPSQGLSSGVSCTPGQGADISMAVKRGKRNMRRAQRS
ncbi:hypothetical protein FGSG_06087 [Fusarium graminearum PH-1]|uniref:Chromosome 3, complete genome n=1 Tax=Gibberella zeae (strain ATCC MYA-4620 / CBS 123657 / FGSC 9075 / NRRL 31084 / PH-1) TaxID=229533 RepID=I1RPV5_GIBZE|nr:hypothetical protein FGSG_06087 [Fusarium graminearum PH-1]ESU12135.1 hypothetical protein FGSG_06087 [Fusarium graminearum PH-1]CAF3550905.1 unnamed protein product [Fusarium graminearum]CEF86154.1 unnamed protein product [Fusarium graminearum]VTO93406.1 unnamed protein product [Fusarium graminearum]|eukprot:XP_011324711.1 hypothetical protein FGSG_06087 [Fusarium graminearum PH-1]